MFIMISLSVACSSSVGFTIIIRVTMMLLLLLLMILKITEEGKVNETCLENTVLPWSCADTFSCGWTEVGKSGTHLL